ncbi:MAG TPA: TetR/AcrR family transcriptional regulator [Gammaproteobacteria bacterium]|nr:TetR/AcrR family transcriptional regulator [Gammaproteobacteria bacterium]
MSELRARKAARTRLALVRALTAALARARLEEVAVKSLCREAEISEATFFNYFPEKQNLLLHVAHLWLLETAWHQDARAREADGLARVERLFDHVARSCERQPGLMRELLAWMLRGGEVDAGLLQDPVERSLAFPELEGIESTPLRGLDALLLPPLEQAIGRGQLPANVPPPLVLQGLAALLLGVPATLLAHNPARIRSAFREQLALFWAGLRASAAGTH